MSTRVSATFLLRSVAVVLAAAAVMTLGALLPVPLLRPILVVPAALLVPGYAALMAISGLRSRQDIVPTLAWSAMLSIVLYPLLALLLNAASLRLSTTSVIAATDIMIMAFVGVIVLRTRFARPLALAHPLVLEVVEPAGTPWSGWRGGVTFAVIVAIVIGTLALVRPLLPAPATAPYTQFYLTGKWSHLHAIAYVPPRRPLAVTLGLSNRSQHTQRYRIVPLLDNTPAWPERMVTLRAAQTWTGTVSGAVPAGGCLHQINITLYQESDHHLVGQLTVWTYQTLTLSDALLFHLSCDQVG